MLLGINLSHESSVAITDKSGIVILAIEEERISRKKKSIGFPFLSLDLIVKNRLVSDQIDHVVFGSNENPEMNLAIDYWNKVQTLKDTRGVLTPESFEFLFLPGQTSRLFFSSKSPKEIVENLVRFILGDLLSKRCSFTWVKHHDSHLGCALGASRSKKSLLVSLDGEGDGESGVIALQNNRSISSRTLLMKDIDSLGLLYSAVTRKYGYLSGRHEGKITGLAAYGKQSAAVEILTNAILIENGVLKLRYAKNRINKGIILELRKIGLCRNQHINITEIVDAAAEGVSIYPDLAFAVQQVLENSVTELIRYWLPKTGTRDVSLAGGVFSNVKLNQRIAEMKEVDNLYIFPNMGDGGLSLGGIWHELARSGNLANSHLYEDMYLGFDHILENKEFLGIKKTTMNIDQLSQFIAKKLSEKKYIGLHQNRMEFGPRALGNRSIIFDPRDAALGHELNRKLGRTEFMPFAPVILEKYFFDYMETQNKSQEAFSYMTITCNVKNDVRDSIPAVVHFDGTARPQIVTPKSNQLLHKILEVFNGITDIPVLVNTSFNVHEEPINGDLIDSIDCLRNGVVDYVVSENTVYETT